MSKREQIQLLNEYKNLLIYLKNELEIGKPKTKEELVREKPKVLKLERKFYGRSLVA